MRELSERIMEEDSVLLGERLQRVRKVKRLYQKELAKDLGISQTYMSYLESGRVEIKVNFLIKWAVRLGLRTNIIFNEIGK
uniref:Putative DNA binding, helix-turn-helix domain containing protein n=1 Tax=viral metagenome TaxID=1070528 RepID=A0A6M3JE49_9ZZZZ